MAHLDGQADPVGEPLKFVLPGAGPVPVAPARIGCDVQRRRLRIGAPPHLAPPVANRGHRKGGRVTVAPNSHPRFVAHHVVDAVRNRLALGVGREVVHANTRRRPTGSLDVRYSSAVWLMCSNCALRSGCVTPSSVCAPTAASSPSSAAAGPRWSSSPATPARSAPPSVARLLQVHRSGAVGSPRVSGCTSASSAAIMPGWSCSMLGRPAPGSDAARWRLAARNLAAPLANRLPGQSRRRRHQGVSAIANGHRLGHRPPTTTALVEHRRDGDVLLNNGGFQFQVPLHAASMAGSPEDSSLIPGRVLPH